MTSLSYESDVALRGHALPVGSTVQQCPPSCSRRSHRIFRAEPETRIREKVAMWVRMPRLPANT
jgi:hypothetical protein